jgi:hypothetical protein
LLYSVSKTKLRSGRIFFRTGDGETAFCPMIVLATGVT